MDHRLTTLLPLRAHNNSVGQNRLCAFDRCSLCQGLVAIYPINDDQFKCILTNDTDVPETTVRFHKENR